MGLGESGGVLAIECREKWSGEMGERTRVEGKGERKGSGKGRGWFKSGIRSGIRSVV